MWKILLHRICLNQSIFLFDSTFCIKSTIVFIYLLSKSKSTLSLKSIETLLSEKLLPITGKIESLHDKVEEVVTSLSFLSEKYDEIVDKVYVLEVNNKQLSTENQTKI